MKKMLKESLFLGVFGLSSAFFSQQVYASTLLTIEKEKTFKCNDVEIERDNYGNLWPKWKDIKEEEIESKLMNILNTLKENESGHAFMAQLTTDEFGCSKHFKKAGFKLHIADEDKMQWVVKNGSPIPAAFTAISAARTLLIQDGNVLIIEDKNVKKIMMFPGGTVDPKELADKAAIREIEEEVGYTIEKTDDLQLVAMFNRTEGNRYGASDYCFYYVCTKFSGDLKIQENEVSQAHWAPISEILENKGYKELKASVISLTILDYLSKKEEKSVSKTLPDLGRQLRKPEKDQDKSDVMSLKLFPVSSKL